MYKILKELKIKPHKPNPLNNNNSNQASKEKEFSWRQELAPVPRLLPEGDILIPTLINLTLFTGCVINQGKKYCFQTRALTPGCLLSLTLPFALWGLKCRLCDWSFGLKNYSGDTFIYFLSHIEVTKSTWAQWPTNGTSGVLIASSTFFKLYNCFLFTPKEVQSKDIAFYFFMYVCVRVCTYVFLHMCMWCICLHVCVYMCMGVCLFVCMCVCDMCVFMSVWCVFTHVCLHVWMCICSIVYMCACMCGVCICMWACVCMWFVCVSDVCACARVCSCVYIVCVCVCVHVCAIICGHICVMQHVEAQGRCQEPPSIHSSAIYPEAGYLNQTQS